jgi:hypothetical protein
LAQKSVEQVLDFSLLFISSMQKVTVPHFLVSNSWPGESEQEELEQWAQAARQKDEDNTAMERYTKSDNARIRELQLEEIKASEEVYNLKQALDAEVTETQSYQIQLDKTAILFRYAQDLNGNSIFQMR